MAVIARNGALVEAVEAAAVLQEDVEEAAAGVVTDPFGWTNMDLQRELTFASLWKIFPVA